MESEFLHEMFGLSIDHYVAVVAVEVGCHVVHRALQRSKDVAGRLRSKRSRAREAKASTCKEGGTRAPPADNPMRANRGTLPQKIRATCAVALCIPAWRSRSNHYVLA